MQIGTYLGPNINQNDPKRIKMLEMDAATLYKFHLFSNTYGRCVPKLFCIILLN
jgi:hypothetical protein